MIFKYSLLIILIAISSSVSASLKEANEADIAQMQPMVFGRGSLFNDYSVGQSFKGKNSQISEIVLFVFGPKNKAPHGKVNLSLRKQWHGKALVSKSYETAKIPIHGKWIHFKFSSPISLIPGEQYYLRIDCDLPKSNRCQVGLAHDYFFNLYPHGNFVNCWKRGKIKLIKHLDLAFKMYSPNVINNVVIKKSKKLLFMNIDYSDNFQLNWAGPNGFGGNKNKTPQQEIFDALKEIKSNGFDGVLWRVSYLGRVMYHSKIRDVFSNTDVKNKYNRNLLKAIEKCDPLKEAVNACHKLGLKIYVWMTINDSGNIKKGRYASFMRKNPQYQWISRDGKKYLPGVPCYAYPEVRKHRISQIEELMGYGIDGLFMSTRSHTTSFSYKTLISFGFNKPVVKAFKKKYGVDIINNFVPNRDALKLIMLRGDMMNQFYREVKELRDRKYPNIKIAADLSHVPQNWPTWVKENLVDYIMIDSVSGNYGIIPSGREYRDIPDFYVDAIKKMGGKTQVLMWIQLVNYKLKNFHSKDIFFKDIYWLGKSKAAGGVLHEHCNILKVPHDFWPYLKKALDATWTSR